ncbi:MAG: SDR family NAD(P)-dependent oxidoreductase, partial [Pseudomonadales bacterium]
MSVFCQGLFEGKVVLVTGGGTGIGKVIARTFGEHGAKVAIASRKQVVLDAAKEELKANGIECIAIACDIRKPEMVALVVNEIIAVWGSLDVLVNNAAGNFPARIEDLSANAFKTVIDIDLQGTFNVSKAAFDAWMKENGGAIINITAPYENFGVAWQAHAAAAKAGVVSFTRSAA